ncbi:MAG: anhydro-N-acetylmuramic acid kinase [Cytophagales bacterium]|nr:anhydro-N-acetylmuramic acid kinase [Bernardetiaceae bacterium]MDW8205410.1 anhydro-N-acetylmuramic acid kinase [Cytophagales bacterium]
MQNSVYVLGMMSGTSLDGLDLALVEFWQNKQWQFRLCNAETVPYSEEWQAKLSTLENSSAFDYALTDVTLGRYFGEQARLFISKQAQKPLFIASHGHTIFHQPAIGLTAQIGNGAALAATAGYPVICDFRQLDVALGGQGAPLVPLGDRLLFAQYDFCVNLGGISNFSTEYEGKRISYDVAFTNMIFNFLANQLGMPYDKSGAVARSGKVLADLLEQFNADPYLQKPFPKSLGKEHFVAYYVPLIEASRATVADLLCTAVHYSVLQLAKNIKQFEHKHPKILLTGGGAFNTFFVELLRSQLPHAEIVVPAPEIIAFKEAIVFAFLGLLRYLRQPNCLASVTGALADNCGGAFWECLRMS